MGVALDSALDLGRRRLANRVVMAPLTRQRATVDHVPTAMMVTHYRDRATAGLIIAEGTAPDPNGAGYLRMPGLWNDAQVAAWRRVTDAVHDAGGVIAVQLMHSGRVGHPDNQPPGARIIAPSSVRADRPMRTAAGHQPCPTPEPMTEADIEETIRGYVGAASRAMEAGFDLIELHGANGYLIEQFIAPCVNQRRDRWGGDIEGRGRFALEVARRCAAEIGPDRVGIRLSPHGEYGAIVPWPEQAEDFVWLAGELGALGLAFLHLLDHSSSGGAPLPVATRRRMRAAFGGPLILCGGYGKANAESDLREAEADLIAYGRPFISNPDLVARLLNGWPLQAPDPSTFFTADEAGYNDYGRYEGAASGD